jgi:hypothetical protein
MDKDGTPDHAVGTSTYIRDLLVSTFNIIVSTAGNR